jgi:hypothetical protein
MKKWILAFAGVAAVIAIGAGAVMAQTPQAGSGTSFWDRVAQKLGIDTSKLTDAVKSARTDQIDEAVQNGDLTQKQADDLKQRLDQMPDGGPGFPGGPKHGGFPLMDGRGFGFGFPDAAGKLADFLGISQDQLKTELQADNATLATVAEAHGKSRDDLKAFIRDNAKAKLDEATSPRSAKTTPWRSSMRTWTRSLMASSGSRAISSAVQECTEAPTTIRTTAAPRPARASRADSSAPDRR